MNLLSDLQTAKHFIKTHKEGLEQLFKAYDNAKDLETKSALKSMIKNSKRLIRKNKNLVAKIEIELANSTLNN